MVRPPHLSPGTPQPVPEDSPFPVRRVAPDFADWHAEAAIVVVGAGGCGLTAALAAAEAGASVLVLEKHARPHPNTARSSGMIPAGGTRFQRAAGIEDSPQQLAADILRQNHGASDPDLTHRLAACAPTLVEWLVDHADVRLELVADLRYPGHTHPRMHAPPSRSGLQLLDDLRAAVVADPRCELLPGRPVTTLLADPADRVLGLALADGQRLRCDRLILACNGFAAAPALVARHCPEISAALYFGAEGSTGEAITWGAALGAQLADLGAYQGHATVAVPHAILITYAVVIHGGILVNLHGDRFGDESIGYSEYALAVLRQPQSRAFAIYDESIHRRALAFDDYKEADQLGAIRKADTLEALAEACHLPLPALLRTFSQYHHPDPFGRRDCTELVPPYRAVQVTGALFHTQGGLRVDPDARVLRPGGAPLPNLYAGGGAAVGLSGRGAGGYLSGNGLLSALGLGLLAGRHAARDLP